MERSKLLELCKDLDIKVRKANDINLRVHCPFAPWRHEGGVDKIPDMYLKVEDSDVSVYHCFACHSKGTVDRLISELAALRQKDYRDLYKKYKEEPKVELLKKYNLKTPEKQEDKKSKCFSIRDLPVSIRPQLIELHEWLDRGISRKTIEKYKVRYDIKNDRIFFPQYSIEGKLVGAIGRAGFESIVPKYYHYNKDISLKDYLYGENFFTKKINHIILVEGQFDVLRMVDYGYRNVFGISGAGVNVPIIKFAEYIDKIYLVFDNDKAGRMYVKDFGRKFSKYFKICIVELPEGKDPCDCTKEEIDEAFKNHKIYGLFSLDNIDIL
mgnify:CR=1 FL=1